MVEQPLAVSTMVPPLPSTAVAPPSLPWVTTTPAPPCAPASMGALVFPLDPWQPAERIRAANKTRTPSQEARMPELYLGIRTLRLPKCELCDTRQALGEAWQRSRARVSPAKSWPGYLGYRVYIRPALNNSSRNRQFRGVGEGLMARGDHEPGSVSSAFA